MNRNKALTLFMVIIGNVLYALSVKLFILPTHLLTGGTTGIGLGLMNYIHLSLSSFVLVFNVLMLLIGAWVLGKEFALTTIVSTFVYPFALEVLQRLLGDFVLTNDIFLCTVFGGLGIGISLGIVIKAGASTGGMDIPPLVLQKLCKIPVANSLYIFDVLILALQWIGNTREHILYGMVLVMIYSLVLDRTLLIGTAKIEVKIISKQHDNIKEAIQFQLDRGVTMLMGKGGYLQQEIELVMTVLSRRELSLIERLVHEIDPEAFLIVSEVTEVSGRGFTLEKQHR